MNLVAYVRVSTGSQVDGTSLDEQRKLLKKWARANGHRIVAVYEDAGLSGTRDSIDRPGLTEALDALRPPPQATGLVVKNLDRLARALHVQEAILGSVWDSGAQVFTAEGGEVLQDDPDDPMRTFVRQVMGAANELDAALVRKRMREGRKAKAERGGYAYGSPPLGYRSKPSAQGSELVPVDSEQATIARIQALRAEDASLRDICATLTAEGHRTKRGGTVWHPTVVARMLARRESK